MLNILKSLVGMNGVTFHQPIITNALLRILIVMNLLLIIVTIFK